MIGFDPWIWVLAALILQPLIALLWAYALYRAAVSFTSAKISATIDGRVNNAVDRLTEADTDG